MVKSGDESHDTIRKKTTKTKHIQENVRVPLDCPTAWNLSWNIQAEIRGWPWPFFKKLLL